jgi:hypothetical protein
MKRSFILFFLISVVLLGLLGYIGYHSQNNEFYTPTLEDYTQSTDRLRTIGDEFLAETDPAAMNKRATALQLSKSFSCIDYNGECKAFYAFLNSAASVSKDSRFANSAILTLRDKYEELTLAIENGKLKLKNQ